MRILSAKFSIVPVLVAAGTLLLAPGSPVFAGVSSDSYGGRHMLVYEPAQLPPKGARALVVVLHGGLGNAARMQGDFKAAMAYFKKAEKGYVLLRETLKRMGRADLIGQGKHQLVPREDRPVPRKPAMKRSPAR